MKTILILLTAILIASVSEAQVEISGKIFDEALQTPLAGVNIKLKHKLVGTVIDPQGNFMFTTQEKLPFDIEVSMVGYQTKSITIESNIPNLKVDMIELIYFGEEIVVSASRVQENILHSSVSVEKLDIRELNATGAPNFYDALANIKGIDAEQNRFDNPKSALCHTVICFFMSMKNFLSS